MAILPSLRTRTSLLLIDDDILSFSTSSAAAALFFAALLVLTPSPCLGGSSSELEAAAPQSSEQLGVKIGVVPDVEVFKPKSYHTANTTTSSGERSSRGFPLLVFLHGFCLPDAAQQEYSFTALRANAGGGNLPKQQTLGQVGLRWGTTDEVKSFLLPSRCPSSPCLFFFYSKKTLFVFSSRS